MKLLRVSGTADSTYGVLIGDDGIPFDVTVERPWLDNQTGISCIPPGTYTCTRFNSSEFGQTFVITGVPDREDIEFHWGNWSSDSKGCVIVGEIFEIVEGRAGIAESKDGFKAFMTKLTGVDSFQLEIVKGY
jgi:hypothetical protein